MAVRGIMHLLLKAFKIHSNTTLRLTISRCHLPFWLAVGFVLQGWFSPLFANDDFRHGVKTHQDWYQRIKKDPDPKILYLLAHRAGRNLSASKAQEFSDWIKKYPKQLDEALGKMGIHFDSKKHEQESTEEWQTLYGKQASQKKSKHYLYLYTKKDEALIRRLSYYMEKVFSFYEKKFDMDEKIAGIFVIKIHANEEIFRRRSNGLSNMFAYFSASDRSLVGYSQSFSSKRRNDEYHMRLIKTFFHEGFHQYLSYYVPAPPTWLNEGMAENFEAMSIRGKKIFENRNLHAGNLDRLKTFMRKKVTTPLQQLIYMSQEEMYANAQVNYPQSWGLIHFFAYGSSRYKKYYQDIILNLKNGLSQKESLDAVFGKMDWALCEEIFQRYILKLKASQSRDSF
jgi:hypothetical protein